MLGSGITIGECMNVVNIMVRPCDMDIRDLIGSKLCYLGCYVFLVIVSYFKEWG